MKYPIFAFVIGVVTTELIHRSGQDDVFFFGVAVVILTVVAAGFEAVWNFK